MSKSGNKNTSWDKVSGWYGNIVREKGHYYHETVILPNLLRLLDLSHNNRILDIGCGQGILGRSVGSEKMYHGIDSSPRLIESAKKMDVSTNHHYSVFDATKDIVTKEKYDRIVFLLSLQNMSKPFIAIRNAAKLLSDGGKLIMVLNHPAFRIPKSSDWGVETDKTKQYRKVYGYMTPKKFPIESSPFNHKENQTTWSFHYPISAISEMIFDNGMVIEKIEEWVSNKKSTGSMAKVEDNARKEIPLFMTIVAKPNR